MDRGNDEISVKDMMNCREKRVEKQKEMIELSHTPIISFCLNIPGPVKTNEQIKKAFNVGKKEILTTLKSKNIPVAKCLETHEKTGDELLVSVNADAFLLKKEMSRIEDTHPLGRLFDIDVIDADGNKLSRLHYRTCLICGLQAQSCARSRRHSAEELFAKTEEIIRNYFLKNPDERKMI
jgi:holo-ACP synthase